MDTKELIKNFINSQDIGFQVDSRLIKKGDVFFAIKGKKKDGHDYLKEVYEKKAILAIVDQKYQKSQAFDLELIRTKNVLKFLQSLAKEKLKYSKAKIIAITGSCGKTTTKEFTEALLSENFTVSESFKNYNSQIGFPISILNMNTNVDFLALEMGMDKKNQIKKLVDIAPPDVGLITQIISYHENFKNIEGVAKAKKEIFSSKKTKLKIINKKFKDLKVFKKDNDYLTYSIYDKSADFYLDISNWYFYSQGKKNKVFLPFKEEHLLENLTASLAICAVLKIKLDTLEKKMKNLKTQNLRFEKSYINGVLFIKDCYNANPISTIAALKNLPKTTGRKIAVLGSNLGLGKLFVKKAHEDIIKVAKENVHEILCYGKEWGDIKNIKIFEHLYDLSNYLKSIIKKDDVVLIKGSRFLEMEKIFDFF